MATNYNLKRKASGPSDWDTQLYHATHNDQKANRKRLRAARKKMKVLLRNIA